MAMFINTTIEAVATILRCPLSQARATYEVPKLSEWLADAHFAEAFLSTWEEACGIAAQNMDVMDDDDVMLRVVCWIGQGRVNTRIVIYEETDFDDD